MYLLQNNTLVKINTKEDNHNLIQIRLPKSELNNRAVRDKVYKVITQYKGDDLKYNLKVIQSPWKDNSGLGDYFATFHTIGNLLQYVSTRIEKYEIYIDGKKFN